ncbi:glucose-6-phosphate dehydrogenase [Streptomyces caniscabiei]|uniref:glucose-6-phosphate dehydrogenase n=1 Tax=Streptomyces caniscabiei TaxID=2746961 RepID=UPI0029A38308|nr:glucose-6-phosphate dehydrogenase [Streptomyces caniscabiei]MDX2775970.1 glucose-6-phosphate dehydrogenase [Streptomyces caniscabiei]
MSAHPTILVIIGITGDLSKRKLLPAIEQLADAGVLPERLRIVGITRQDMTKDTILATQPQTLYLEQYLEMYRMDLAEAVEYDKLKAYLEKIEADLGAPAQKVFYLSIPPQFSRSIVERLGTVGFARDSTTKLLLEKPFGTDLMSARELVAETKQAFSEAQIYRIDHYLAKEMAQNLIVFRGSNALFRRTWNRDFIERIEIVASEKIGIEGRVEFYEQTGALRDLVQSHLLQLAALVLMNVPRADALDTVPVLRYDALKQLRLSADTPAIRGQYDTYQQEAGNIGSTTETYVDLTLESLDERWLGVPIRIVTGKALREKATYIRIIYKKNEAHEANELVISLQPGAAIKLRMWTKVPGYERKLEQHDLKISLEDQFPIMPEAYEQVLLDAINTNHALFASSDEVLETWRIIQPLLDAWQMDMAPLTQYEKGTVAGQIKAK